MKQSFIYVTSAKNINESFQFVYPIFMTVQKWFNGLVLNSLSFDFYENVISLSKIEPKYYVLLIPPQFLANSCICINSNFKNYFLSLINIWQNDQSDVKWHDERAINFVNSLGKVSEKHIKYELGIEEVEEIYNSQFFNFFLLI